MLFFAWQTSNRVSDSHLYATFQMFPAMMIFNQFYYQKMPAQHKFFNKHLSCKTTTNNYRMCYQHENCRFPRNPVRCIAVDAHFKVIFFQDTAGETMGPKWHTYK